MSPFTIKKSDLMFRQLRKGNSVTRSLWFSPRLPWGETQKKAGRSVSEIGLRSYKSKGEVYSRRRQGPQTASETYAVQ